MKRVKFIVSHSVYNPGEIAGFSDVMADDLIERGLAVPVYVVDLGDVAEKDRPITIDTVDKRRPRRYTKKG